MAGNYPDALGERMPYDLDGTIVAQYDGSSTSVTVLTTAQKQALNNESNDTYSAQFEPNAFIGFLFPQLRDLVAYFESLNQGTLTIETSTNTTTLLDGTWTSRGVATNGGLGTAYRTQNALAVPGVKAVRFRNAGGGLGISIAYLHLYGKRQAGTSPLHSLDLWHPTSDQALSVTPALLDMAEVARSSTATKSFRVKNLSPSKVANSVTVSLRILTDAATTLVGQIQFSADGGTTWANSVNIGALAAGAISAPVQVRYSPSAAATLGVFAQRIEATAASFA